MPLVQPEPSLIDAPLCALWRASKDLGCEAVNGVRFACFDLLTQTRSANEQLITFTHLGPLAFMRTI